MNFTAICVNLLSMIFDKLCSVQIDIIDLILRNLLIWICSVKYLMNRSCNCYEELCWIILGKYGDELCGSIISLWKPNEEIG